MLRLLPAQYAWLAERVQGVLPSTSPAAIETLQTNRLSTTSFRRGRRIRRMFRGIPVGSRPPLLTYLVPRGRTTGSSDYFANSARLRSLLGSVSPLFIAGPAGIFTRNLEGVEWNPR